MINFFSKIAGFSAIAALLSFSGLTAFAADLENPGDVESLDAVAQNEAVALSWSAATDDVGVEGYQIHYGITGVTEEGQTYDSIVDAGDVLEYTVSGLDNDTTYYFSIIAYDAEGKESSNWSPEASVTPSADAGSIVDVEAPKVSSAESLNIEEVKVVFSEAVVLPLVDTDLAFRIENQDNFEPLDVIEAKIDEKDATGKTVIITTVAQTKGASYKLEVGIDIEDKSGNTIISGTSDTALFTGTDIPKPSEDDASPKITGIEVIDSTHLVLTFDETVFLGIDPSQNFTIIAEDDATVKLNVIAVELGASDAGVEDAAAIITTSPQEARSYLIVVENLKDTAGNPTIASEANGTFEGFSATSGGTTTNPGDVDLNPTAATDVANFLAKKVFDAGAYLVTLSWDVPAGNIENVSQQVLYMSTDKGNEYAKKAVLAADIDQYELSGLSAGEYWFKLTQVDNDGKESSGVISKIILPEVGPGGVAGIIALSLGLGRFVSKKRK